MVWLSENHQPLNIHEGSCYIFVSGSGISTYHVTNLGVILNVYVIDTAGLGDESFLSYGTSLWIDASSYTA